MKDTNRKRCPWAGDLPTYQAYHDTEWGRPVHDDRLLFESLVLDGAQAGLSWLTILKKRDHYRQVFDNFDPVKVAQYDQKKVETLMQDPGIIRNRLKIESAISNAQAFLQIVTEFGSFDRFLWGYVEFKPVDNQRKSINEIPVSTPLSDRLSKDLKKRGFRFVGTTIIYAFLQAVGVVNDHLVDCFVYDELKNNGKSSR